MRYAYKRKFAGGHYMKLRWLLVFSVMVCANAQASQFPIQVIEQFDDVRIVAFINEDDVNDSAAWNPLEEAPPLSIASAIGAIKKHSAENASYPSAFSITEIELRQIPLHKNRWHYLIKIRSNVDHEFKNTFYVVLMNGKIIPAIVEPRSIK